MLTKNIFRRKRFHLCMSINSTEVMLIDLEVLPEFFNGGHNLNNIRYANHTVLIADKEIKLQELLEKVLKKV